MNESAPPLPASYKNRHGGLIAFGIVLIVMGCLCALFVPLMLWGQQMSAQRMNTAPSYRRMLPVVWTYGALAVTFIWLGIGSILARRWARALLLILGWGWLVTGVITEGVMAWLMPKIVAHVQPSAPAVPEAALAAAMIGALIVVGLFFILLPGGLILFYRSRNVQATCEARDPVPRWTDACPLPVLALSLLLAFGALWMLSMPLCFNSVIPCFGRLLSGAPGTALWVPMIALWSYCAWATYRLKPLGWTLTVTGMVVMALSAFITFIRVDIFEMYRLMNYPEDQIRQMQKSGLFNSRALPVVMAFSWLPFFGYLLYVKKFFRRPL